MTPEIVIPTLLLLANIITTWLISWNINKHVKSMEEHRKALKEIYDDN